MTSWSFTASLLCFLRVGKLIVNFNYAGLPVVARSGFDAALSFDFFLSIFGLFSEG